MARLILILTCLGFCSTTSAQFLSPRYSSYAVPHLLYLEVQGNGTKYSVNYENLIVSEENVLLGARFGLGAAPIGSNLLQFGVPITISVMAGGNRFFGELGAGTRVIFDNRVLENGLDIMPTGIAGIRFHPDRSGGIFLKAAYTPYLMEGQYFHRAGLAIGIGFDGR
ncbi:MAG: hypothetical protein AAF206_18595 [Bacteroidota bacterium]